MKKETKILKIILKFLLLIYTVLYRVITTDSNKKKNCKVSRSDSFFFEKHYTQYAKYDLEEIYEV